MVMQKVPITAVIIAKNEDLMIEGCINALLWCKEILVIDNGSTDQTVAKAEALGARVISINHPSFARLRNEGLKKASNDWILYIDADERVTPTLAKEIQVNIETNQADVFLLRRQNIFYGTELKNGGWDTDQLERVFQKSSLKEWTGTIHESPQITGKKLVLQTPLIHLSHRSTRDGLEKTMDWTQREAKLFIDQNAAPVSPLIVIRKAVMEFIRRAFIKKGYKDGQVGLIEAIVQAINRALVYIQVWEMQQNPSISETYKNIEKDIADAWKKES